MYRDAIPYLGILDLHVPNNWAFPIVAQVLGLYVIVVLARLGLETKNCYSSRCPLSHILRRLALLTEEHYAFPNGNLNKENGVATSCHVLHGPVSDRGQYVVCPELEVEVK